MPRRSPKRPAHALKSAVLLPAGTADEHIVKWPEITHPTDERWDGIEKAYGHPLSSEVRRALLESMYCFIVLAQMESAGASAKAVDKRLADIRTHAKALLAALTAEGDTALLTHDLIEWAGVDLDRLRGLLTVLEHVWDQLPVLRPHKKGEAWDAWARNVTAICNRHHLPIEARQDGDAERKPSPFVVFVGKLQASLSPNLQRHTHSSVALASAINRARFVADKMPRHDL